MNTLVEKLRSLFLRWFMTVDTGQRTVAIVAISVTTVLLLVSGPWDEGVVQSEILHGDAGTYFRLSEAIPSFSNWKEIDPGAQRTPGYPLFIAVVNGLSGGNLWLVFVIQGIVHVMTALMVLALGRLMTDKRSAVVAGLLYGTSILATWYAVHELFSETLFTFFVVLAIYLSAKMISGNRQSVSNLIFLGLVIGFAAWIRPNGLWLLISAPLALALARLEYGRLTPHWFLPVVLIPTVSFLTVMPWALTNLNTYGSVGLSTNQGTNLLKIASRIELVRGGLDVARAREAVGFGRVTPIKNPFERSRAASDLALRYFIANPVETAEHWATGGISWLFNIEKSIILYEVIGVERPDTLVVTTLERLPDRIARVVRESSRQYFLAPILLLKQVLVIFSAAVGLSLIWRQSKLPGIVLIFGTFVSFWLLTGPFGFSPRFRIPADPTIFIMAGAGITLLWSRFRGYLPNLVGGPGRT